MTRKDYIALAEALKRMKPEVSRPDGLAKVAQWLKDVSAVCSVLSQDNPRFDWDRFENACGIEH